MCGIVGFTGTQDAISILLAGLHTLEYRGYDSAGVSAFEKDNLRTVKAKGRLANLEEKLAQHPIASTCGIGHTRWATHGEPSDVNSHPHATAHLALVHNGIVENYAELKEELIKKGYTFLSMTDTEVAAVLLEDCYCACREPLETIRRATARLKGSYAFGILFRDLPGRIYAVRRGSPLLVAPARNGSMLASDIPALLQYADSYVTLEEEEIACLTPTGITYYDAAGREITKKLNRITWDADAAQKGGYAHFMLKEIHEEPEALQKTLHAYMKDGMPDFSTAGLSEEQLRGLSSIRIVACGTARHAGLAAKNMIEARTDIPVSVEIASEFRYSEPHIGKKDLIVLISQSGETADTLAAMRLAKQHGCFTLAVVNVLGSTLAREADGVIYTKAGPEISVASTKAYIVQVGVLYLFAIYLGFVRGETSREDTRSLSELLCECVPGVVAKSMEKAADIEKFAKELAGCDDIFFIGRGLDYALCEEASLKMKEISYIHCDAYAAGELKHGTISLITPGTPVVAIASQRAIAPKTVSNICEARARGAHAILICNQDFEGDTDGCEVLELVPGVPEAFAVFSAAVYFQLLAYYTALARGCDIDKPRNLAKSVTVE